MPNAERSDNGFIDHVMGKHRSADRSDNGRFVDSVSFCRLPIAYSNTHTTVDLEAVFGMCVTREKLTSASKRINN